MEGRVMWIAGPRWVCTNGWAGSRSFASQQHNSLGSVPKKPTCLAESHTAHSGLAAERMVGNGENWPSLDQTFVVQGKLWDTITNCLNKTVRKEVMWGGFGCIFEMQPNALASPTSEAGFHFSSLGPVWLHTSSCWGRFVGAGSEHGDCSVLLCPCSQLHMELLQPGGQGLVWGGAVLAWGWHSCEWAGGVLVDLVDVPHRE